MRSALPWARPGAGSIPWRPGPVRTTPPWTLGRRPRSAARLRNLVARAELQLAEVTQAPVVPGRRGLAPHLRTYRAVGQGEDAQGRGALLPAERQREDREGLEDGLPRQGCKPLLDVRVSRVQPGLLPPPPPPRAAWAVTVWAGCLRPLTLLTAARQTSLLTRPGHLHSAVVLRSIPRRSVTTPSLASTVNRRLRGRAYGGPVASPAARLASPRPSFCLQGSGGVNLSPLLRVPSLLSGALGLE